MRTLLLKNGKIVTSGGIKDADVFVQDGKIEKIAPRISVGAERVIDIGGKYLLPGLIDAHVHFRVPGGEAKEDWRTGSRAAVRGGVTTVLDMPNNNPPSVSEAALDGKRKIAARDSLVNYGFYILLSRENASRLREFKNIAGVKIYMGESTGGYSADMELIKKALTNPPRLIAVHAEDAALIEKNKQKFKDLSDPEIHSVIRDAEAAHKAVVDIIGLAEAHNAAVHICHVSTREELFEIRIAKQRGLKITCEATPHHLFLTNRAYKIWKNFVKVNPPLRTPEDKKALWEDGIGLGLLDIIATDHAPHLKSEKEKNYWEAPAGIPSIELMLPLFLDAFNRGRLSLEKIVELTAAGPARVFGIEGKGEIRQGADADLIIVDLDLEGEVRDEDLATKCGWSPYRGMKLRGWPVAAIIGGEIVYENGKFSEKFRGREVIFFDSFR